MWELGTIEGVGNITCTREPFLHRASAHDEQKIYPRDDIIFDNNICNQNEIHFTKTVNSAFIITFQWLSVSGGIHGWILITSDIILHKCLHILTKYVRWHLCLMFWLMKMEISLAYARFIFLYLYLSIYICYTLWLCLYRLCLIC